MEDDLVGLFRNTWAGGCPVSFTDSSDTHEEGGLCLLCWWCVLRISNFKWLGVGGWRTGGQRVFISSFSLVVVVGLLGTERLWGNHKTNPKTQSSEKGSVA